MSLLLIPGTIRAQVLYGAIGGSASSSDLYIVDPATADATPVGPIGFSATGLSTDPLSGELYGVTAGQGSRQLLVIDTVTGAGTAIGPVDGPIPDISFSSAGTLYGWTENSDDLVTINTATGATAVVGESGIGTFGSGLDFNPSGVLYFAGSGSSGTLYTINPGTGAATAAGTLTGAPAGSSRISALAFHPTTGVLYGIAASGGSGTSDLVTIDTTTGVITLIGALPAGFDALAWGEAAAVPAMPMPMLLVLAVLTAVVASVMLRRRARVA